LAQKVFTYPKTEDENVPNFAESDKGLANKSLESMAQRVFWRKVAADNAVEFAVSKGCANSKKVSVLVA
jgi:hypothetical protein